MLKDEVFNKIINQSLSSYLLFNQLSKTKANFILSTWHHNDYRENEMIEKYWSKFNIITRDHFYHSGGKIENRRSIVEALVCNYELAEHVAEHHHGRREKPEQLTFFESEEITTRQQAIQHMPLLSCLELFCKTDTLVDAQKVQRHVLYLAVICNECHLKIPDLG